MEAFRIINRHLWHRLESSLDVSKICFFDKEKYFLLLHLVWKSQLYWRLSSKQPYFGVFIQYLDVLIEPDIEIYFIVNDLIEAILL